MILPRTPAFFVASISEMVMMEHGVFHLLFVGGPDDPWPLDESLEQSSRGRIALVTPYALSFRGSLDLEQVHVTVEAWSGEPEAMGASSTVEWVPAEGDRYLTPWWMSADQRGHARLALPTSGEVSSTAYWMASPDERGSDEEEEPAGELQEFHRWMVRAGADESGERHRWLIQLWPVA